MNVAERKHLNRDIQRLLSWPTLQWKFPGERHHSYAVGPLNLMVRYSTESPIRAPKLNLNMCELCNCTISLAACSVFLKQWPMCVASSIKALWARWTGPLAMLLLLLHWVSNTASQCVCLFPINYWEKCLHSTFVGPSCTANADSSSSLAHCLALDLAGIFLLHAVCQDGMENTEYVCCKFW